MHWLWQFHTVDRDFPEAMYLYDPLRSQCHGHLVQDDPVRASICFKLGNTAMEAPTIYGLMTRDIDGKSQVHHR